MTDERALQTEHRDRNATIPLFDAKSEQRDRAAWQ